MIKKIRFLFWLSKAFVQKHTLTILFTTIISFSAIAVLIRFSSQTRLFLLPKRKHIGIVGLYTPSTLPRFVQNKISIGLIQLNAQLEPLPAAASSWEIKDKGKTYIFNIRTGLLWHDGKSVESNDINYNFKDVTITPINKQVLKITLKDPFSPLPSLLSKPLFRENLTGLGPYKAARLITNGEYIERIDLEPLDPQIDSAQTIKFYPTLTQAVTAFKLGEINTLEIIENAPDLLDWNNLVVKKEKNTNQFISVIFNTQKKPFDEKYFRQALAHSISKDISKGYLKSPIQENSWAYNPELKKIQYNEDKALELLEKSGMASEQTNITIYAFPALLETANKLKSSWEKLGLKISIKVINTIPQDYSILLTIQEVPNDPDQYPLWHSIQTQANLSKYSNPKIDKLLEDGRKSFIKDERRQIYWEFQKYIMDELPALFLEHPINYIISRK